MVGCIVDDAIALINESLCATILCGVIDIGFVVRAFRQKPFAIAVGIAANHDADGYPRVKVPLFKRLACLRFVKLLTFAFVDVIRGQFVELAQVCGYGIFSGVFAGFLDCFVDACVIDAVLNAENAIFDILWSTCWVAAFIIGTVCIAHNGNAIIRAFIVIIGAGYRAGDCENRDRCCEV